MFLDEAITLAIARKSGPDSPVGSRYYDPSSLRGAKVRALFDRIAIHYDLINDLQSFGLHRRWKKRLIGCVTDSRAGKSALVLDLCTGTGDIGGRLARCGHKVVGLDFSRAMLQLAASRFAGKGEGLCLIQGNAEETPFRDESFDAVTIAYGLRNLTSTNQAIQEMWRLVRPGGAILILEFSKPQNALWRTIYFLYLRAVVPFFGWCFHGDAATYRYIFESLQAYPSAQMLSQELREATGTEPEAEMLLGGVMAIHHVRKCELRSAKCE